MGAEQRMKTVWLVARTEQQYSKKVNGFERFFFPYLPSYFMSNTLACNKHKAFYFIFFKLPTTDRWMAGWNYNFFKNLNGK